MLIFLAAARPIINQKYNGVESLIGNATCAGLAVMITILSTSHIFGAHLNPSVTIAFAALGHFPWAQVLAYIAIQVSACICDLFVLKGIFHHFMSSGVTIPSDSTAQTFTLEFIIMFVVTAVATDTRAVGQLASIPIGAIIVVNILVTRSSSSGCPAITTGNYKSIWIYLVAPTLGALIGATIYTVVKLWEEGEPTSQPKSFRH